MDSNVFKFWLEGIALPVVGCIGVTGGEMLKCMNIIYYLNEMFVIVVTGVS